MKKVFIIAGEVSGDIIGAKLIRALKEKMPNQLAFKGVGGSSMLESGIDSIFPMKKISIMGFLEILPKLFELLGLIKFTVDEIIKFNPDILITIDSPGFNFKVAQKVKKINPNIKLMHYVAPSVWAYKPKRAAKIAKIYDHLLTLLPFEPKYFIKEGLDTTFVGHPIVENYNKANKKLFKAEFKIGLDDTLVTIMPGSRRNEIQKLMPIFADVMVRLAKKYPNIAFVITSFPEFASEIKAIIGKKIGKVVITTTPENKTLALSASNVALVKSGTSALDVALEGTPMVIAYKVHPFSAFLLKLMIKIPYVNLINILLNKPIIPELLQENCTAEKITLEISKLIDDENLANTQKNSFDEALKMIGLGSANTASDIAANVCIEYLNR